MTSAETIEVPIEGMDCADCVMHVQKAISGVEGVESVDVFLISEKAIIRGDKQQIDLESIRRVVKKAGYSVPEENGDTSRVLDVNKFTRQILALLGFIFAALLFVVVAGEWLGLFELVSGGIPWFVGLAVVALGGYPVFKKVL